MHSKTQRLNQIMDILQAETTVTTKDLSSRLNVSDMTIRRDVQELSKRGLVNAYYGGITLTSDPTAPQAMSPQQRSNYFSEAGQLYEKDTIARYASQLIEARDAIAIDNGTTCSQITQYMDPEMSLIIYTYSYMVLNRVIAAQDTKWQLFVLGGYYHDDIKIFEYEETLNTIRKLHINKLFIGAAGVSDKYGISCVQPFEVPIRKALIEASDNVILLADSSKLGKSWFDHYAQLSEIDMLITDSGISEDQKKRFEDMGVDLRIVST